tara:strand:+ start:64 stop:306 length:243 start_codon:yes stop_codon:yes gene_type:complete
MAKKEKEKSDILTLDEKEYEINSMSSEQQMMVAHLRDIQNKQASNRFIADQLQVGHDGFVNMLRESLNNPSPHDPGDEND